ncbi:MAG: hypothetical protein ACTSVU_01945 [Promethearchaeota archaeon]
MQSSKTNTRNVPDEKKHLYTRHALISQKMGFNQMRNSIYWLQRLMRKYHLSDTEIYDHLFNMGKNIGATFVQELKSHAIPSSLLDYISFLYKITVLSKVKVIQEGHIITVTDPSGAISKYQYPDIKVSGEVIVLGMINEMLDRTGFPIEKARIVQCVTYGDKQNIHEYILKMPLNNKKSESEA